MTTPSDNPRPRPDPKDRFQGPAHQHNLALAFDQLAREAAAPHHGHRQITLYQDKSLTLAIFAFSPGAALKAHKAPGQVIIQVISGQLTVEANGVPHPLNQGELIVLAPNVIHAVVAPVACQMLLTVAHP